MKRPKTNVVYQFKITLKETKPPIWRRFLVDSDMKLSDLHKVIQTVMGWTNSHLYAFRIENTGYALPDLECPSDDRDSRKVRLNEVVRRERQMFTYEYDFGDGWNHTIVLEKIVPRDPAVKYPLCVKGARSCPPEDCGGPWGYANLLRILNDPSDEEYGEYKEWVGEYFAPEEFDPDFVTTELRRRNYGCYSW